MGSLSRLLSPNLSPEPSRSPSQNLFPFRRVSQRLLSISELARALTPSMAENSSHQAPPLASTSFSDPFSDWKRKGGNEERVGIDGSAEEAPSTSDFVVASVGKEIDDEQPIVLVTNGDGIDSPGLVSLVEVLVLEGLYNVHVCSPQTDKSASAHSMTPGETIAATSVNIKGAFEVSGTPVDCISLGALFAWSKPILVSTLILRIPFQVISGINQGSSCRHQMFYSGVVAGAREALISGAPSLSISLNWLLSSLMKEKTKQKPLRVSKTLTNLECFISLQEKDKLRFADIS